MAAVAMSPKNPHVPPSPDVKRPRGILKNSFLKSPPPPSPTPVELTDKELTIANTQANAGHRRSSSTTSRPAGSRRQSSRAPANGSAIDDEVFDGNQRLKWDEANLYLTEQERTSTMKITEPKTPYARHYEPSEDDEDEDVEMALDGRGSRREEIPGLSLGEPEEEVPEDEFGPARNNGRHSKSKVHVSDEDATPQHDAENEYLLMTPEEREKHRKFEQLRKKHYEMKDVARFLGHPESLDEIEDDDDKDNYADRNGVPPVPRINGAKVGAGD
ncbi:hypothetical protein GGS23DRAFT_320565 [Durotheca rogersii]|uniref:uncharacterized protein n=1 Tax=Durotheca rogersii TaxID=419775 RepID=UPI00221E753A|nr:uncharacterized protein GGS23DRAFT_320565 [Durotheca rogersii]KAI5859507.1 hypothetical protein GGS23DRAFT_320565 [Durotheca rogersii]